MTETQHTEKAEKTEKEEEKRTDREEKSWDEKWRRDPLAAAGFAVVLVWAGLVLLAENLGMLRAFRPLEPWDLIFIGAGLIVLAGAAIRVLVPTYRRPVGGSLILGVILIAIGLGDVVRSGLVWAGALILLGGFLLLRAILRR